MASPVRRPRPWLTALAGLAAALTAAGCVSMPSGGPVRSYSVTQAANGQSQQYVQMVPQPPGKNWSPAQVVQGFLTASASFGTQGNKVALEYLTPQAAQAWSPLWSAIVYKDGPVVNPRPVMTPGAKSSAIVKITGQEQAVLKGNGIYSVPSASARDAAYSANQEFQLVREAGGQWRISVPPTELLLTNDAFRNDYQLHSLYFYDPGEQYLVPDPVYVPLQASEENLVSGLVTDLIKPPGDWLSGGATKTALPPGTKLAGVTFDGVTALVNLTGTVTKARPAVLQNILDQLAWTLSANPQNGASGQTVQSVALELNGKPWNPGSPVQPSSSKNKPASGSGSVFYYVDSTGNLVSRDGIRSRPVRIEPVGTGVSQLAVSRDARYVAVLRGHELYTGLAGSPLTRQKGSSYSAVSWDSSDDLWASAGSLVYLFRGVGRKPLADQVAVNVTDDGIPDQGGPFYQLKVAPDGVRVALVMDTDSGQVLTIGAISGQQGASPQITLSQVQLTPRTGTKTFAGLSWYDSDNVIALTQPGPVATEYAVSGGSSTLVPVDAGMQSVAASAGNPLLAALPNGQLAANVSLSGPWARFDAGYAPTYPG